MRIVPSSEVHASLSRIAPSYRIHLFDEQYYAPKRDELERLLYETYFNKYDWTKDLFDCNTFALCLMAYVRQLIYAKREKEPDDIRWKEPWALGRLVIPKTQVHHMLNWCYTSTDGLLLIEPQTDGIREPYRNEKALFADS
jgi:hypothetical protein